VKGRIGLMGGTFDPIHLGHLVAAECAMEAASLDEIRFMPTYQPPHKSGDQGATPDERRAMVELAIASQPKFRLEPIELDRGGVSYSVDTAAELATREPNSQFFWIIGGDMVQYLPQWHEIEKLAGIVSFIGLHRPGYPIRQAELPPFLHAKLQFAEMPALDISSTDIRQRCREGRSIRYIVPEEVRRFIVGKGLYSHDRELG